MIKLLVFVRNHLAMKTNCNSVLTFLFYYNFFSKFNLHLKMAAHIFTFSNAYYYFSERGPGSAHPFHKMLGKLKFIF